MPTFYSADAVDPMLKAASDTMRALTDCLEEAQAETEDLRTKVARYEAALGEKVELQKVAARPALTKDKVNRFADMLAERAIIQPEMRDKYAAACMQDPNNALEFGMQAIKLLEAPRSQGEGYGTMSGSMNASAGNYSKAASIQRENAAWEELFLLAD